MRTLNLCDIIKKSGWLVGLVVPFLHAVHVEAQSQFHELDYSVELSASNAFEGKTPLWLLSNRYGLSTLQESSAYLRVGIGQRSLKLGNTAWSMNYGADVVVPINYATENPYRGKQYSRFLVQQLYAELDYKAMRISVGSKERPLAMKHQRLSSGGQTFGINARPVPQLRIEIPHYTSLVGEENPWLAFKGHFGYGIFTDGSWQRSYAKVGAQHADGTILHSKAGYIRMGNPARYPIVLEGGLEMACQFGGTIYNPWSRVGKHDEVLKMEQGIPAFVDAVFGLGSDATDGAYKNAAGNSLGSWMFALTYHAKDWSLRAYYDHYFEDHSMMFFQYGWLDGMLGLELQLPKNKWLKTIVYEYLRTTYQAGAVYHDETTEIPDQISAIDNYYNHNLYPGWQHWGQAIGNPLFTTPLYEFSGELLFPSNRFEAHHIGLEGSLYKGLDYRVLLSYATHLGRYAKPYLNRKFMTSGLCELNYDLSGVKSLAGKGWNLSFSCAFDKGAQVGNNTGVQFSIKKTGFILKQ